ncbi:hypothetical protein GCM10027452_04870 [Micromonospora halotolerans]
MAVATILDYLSELVRPDTPTAHPASVLAGLRRDFYQCLTRRADVLFELTDAVLCNSLVDLTLKAEQRRGHRALYDGLNRGRVEVHRLRTTLNRVPPARTADGRIALAAMSVTGCARTHQPRPTGCSATSTAGRRVRLS